MEIKEDVIAKAKEFEEKYSNFCVAARALRMMQDDLENLQEDIATFREETLAGHSEDEDDYFDLEDMCDDVENEFKDIVSISLDDAISLCEELNSDD